MQAEQIPLRQQLGRNARCFAQFRNNVVIATAMLLTKKPTNYQQIAMSIRHIVNTVRHSISSLVVFALIWEIDRFLKGLAHPVSSILVDIAILGTMRDVVAWLDYAANELHPHDLRTSKSGDTNRHTHMHLWPTRYKVLTGAAHIDKFGVFLYCSIK